MTKQPRSRIYLTTDASPHEDQANSILDANSTDPKNFPSRNQPNSNEKTLQTRNHADDGFQANCTAPGDITRARSAIGLLLLYVALGITSIPLFDRTIDAEQVRDNAGILTTKNASYAKAYFLPKGFFSVYTTAMENNISALEWYPQPTDTAFLGVPYMDQPAKGACAILDYDDLDAPDCILMTSHLGRLAAYGLCRNDNLESIIPSGNWIETSRESVLTGVTQPPTCMDGNVVEIYPNTTDLRGMSGPFEIVAVGRTTQWFDFMDLPTAVRQEMHYLSEKAGSGEGVFLPNRKRQSFDGVIGSDTAGVTLASKLVISTPYSTSKHAYVTLYRLATTTLSLPRLQFTLAVAGQALVLLLFMLVITSWNGALNTYHLVVQILRLPTFCIIAVQLAYVAYYQIFSMMFLLAYDSPLFMKKLIYISGILFILLLQLDVRSAVTLWPKMANNDAYYLWRITWMLTSLGVFIWRAINFDPVHYTIAVRPDCPLNANECNTTSIFLAQHYVVLASMLLTPLAYTTIQVMQYHLYKHEYIPPDKRTAEHMTTFEANCCGDPLGYYYYYKTLVLRKGSDDAGLYMTCGKAVRDEGFVLLGGCDMLIRAKDMYVVLLFKSMTPHMAKSVNLSIVGGIVKEGKLSSLRRVSYRRLYQICRKWNGRISYPDIA